MCTLSYIIVNRIYSAMLDKKLSIDELASMALITPLNLKRIFSHKYDPSLVVIERLFNVLDLEFKINRL